jgi:hypothetical protein
LTVLLELYASTKQYAESGHRLKPNFNDVRMSLAEYGFVAAELTDFYQKTSSADSFSTS